MPAPKEVISLVERFRLNLKDYRSGKYNETQVRLEFIDPFFETLGWDVHNKKGYAEAYKDVVHEDQVKVGGATKAPDYGFRIGGTRKFFVEAKKPSIDIKDDVHPAYQLRRYAWSAKLPLSILTDFEELAVYDCRIRPVMTDKTGTARVMYFTFNEYVEKWDEIAEIFSREAVLQGSFDRYAESSKRKRGTAEVDTAFLEEIERWRETLARNIALRNSGLTVRDLNFAVQRTIDRIIFLRIAEDRGLEHYGLLRNLGHQKDTYSELCRQFLEADNRYNSGLFHFKEEKGRQGIPDELTIKLNIDDKVLKDILRNLYYPDSPYEFSVLPAEILGQVYEQFLGKVIRLTAGGQAKVEDKPEVKKAKGVYYTPTYIVDYIVEQTVGKLLAGLTPRDAAKLKICDPACGSGSFLLGAYQYLLDWHRDFYVADDPEKYTRAARGRIQALYQGQGGEWRLTTAEKRRILLNNIYGVDIDPQAVEVTKLSLLLKVLEGENEGSMEQQLAFFQERALPDLGGNIKCGNSLIAPDYYTQEGQQLPIFNTEEMYRINAFDWDTEFSEIMTTGGFDAVIGNPPYIRIQALKEFAPKEVEIYKQAYESASKGNYDIYVVFVEKGLHLLNENGVLGYIIPSKFFSTDYGEILRNVIAKQKSLRQIVDFGHSQVFEQATTYTCLLFLSNSPNDIYQYSNISPPTKLANETTKFSSLSTQNISASPWLFLSKDEELIIERLIHNSITLGDFPSLISRGSSSGADNVFILSQDQNGYLTRDGIDVSIENEILRIPIFATDFNRYSFEPKSQEFIIFPYDVTEKGYSLKEETELQQDFPLAYNYLKNRKKELESRKQYKAWYGFSAPRNLNVHETAQLLVPLLANRGSVCRIPIQSNDYCLMASGGFSIKISNKRGLSPNYVLGLLNSQLLFWRLRSSSNKFRGGWITCTKQYVQPLPIYKIDFSNPNEASRHDHIVTLVEQMLKLNKSLSMAKSPTEKQMLQRQIETTDKQIDVLVYELYELTEEEIRIVEES